MPAVFTADVEPGIYDVDARADDRVAPSQTIQVGGEPTTATVFVGPPGSPYYRLGSTLVPYVAHDDVIAIVDEDAGVQDDDSPFEALPETMARFGLVPVTSGDDAEAASSISSIQLYTAPQDRSRDDVEIHDQVQNALGGRARVGMPVNLQAGQLAVVDRYFVVRFVDDVDPNQAEALVEEAGAEIIRPLRQSPNGYLIRFRSGHPREHIEQLERWHGAGLLVYGEPDLITEITDDVFPYTDPSDPTFGAQVNLTLQRVPEAWVDLADIDPLLTTGSGQVAVATIDRGIDVDHPDLGGPLARCFDFSGMRECTVAGYTPDTDHGMGVYGIVAAASDNAENIAGIAPNTRHIGLERPGLNSVNYADMLLWTAGFETGNTTLGWPAEPLRPAADVISCSHGQNNLALSGTMDDTLRMLTDQGRNGLGTVVVYSAGNSNALVTGLRTWAGHARTIAVANSIQPNAAGIETRAASSNFGPEIDVCAQGDGAPSLDASGGEQTFSGTSAAAPTVAAICALVLSVDPKLTWRQVRNVLRRSGVVIDGHNTDPVGQWIDGFSQWYGYGRVDAAAAVALALPDRGRIGTDHDGDGRSELPVTSPWGIGTLEFRDGGITALSMARNGSRFGGWLLNSRDNRFDVMADLDSDGRDELLVTSPWGIGVLNVVGGTYAATMLRRNGTRFGGWLLNTADNRFGPAGDFDADGRVEFLVSSPWGIGVFRLSGATFTVPTMSRNGSRFDGWLLNTADNRFGPVGDFDGDGADEILVSSPWGIGVLKQNGSTFDATVIKPNGTRFDGWLLNTADNRFGPVGDFDGDGADEILVSSPWGIGVLKQNGSTFDATVIKPNGTRFGGWLLNTADNSFRGSADFVDHARDQLFVTSPWGIGVLEQRGDLLDAIAMAPNGSRFDGWLLNTDDNHFKRFSDITGDGTADVLATSPWGIGVLSVDGSTFRSPFLAPNGTRFGGWLLNTDDNCF